MSVVDTHAGKGVALPEPVPAGEFFAALREGASGTWRVAALFGVRRAPDVELLALLANDRTSTLRVARTRVAGSSFPSLTREHPQLHLFEREIHEQTGLVPEGHPWLKPVRFTRTEDTIGVTGFYAISGESVHEVGVGPVHAGIIEPGHFRFQCHGESVFHLEISLGYQHRGVERALLAGPPARAVHLAETLAGDTTIGHATAHCEAIEGLAGIVAPPRAQAIRAVALELERLANHIGDLGALAGDVAFLPTSSYCGRIRGDFLNLTMAVCGSRFGRGLVVPGGVAFDVTPAIADDLLEGLAAAARDAEGATGLLWGSAAAMGRFEETGTVTADVASELGLVGPAARASGLPRDVRHDHPSGLYRMASIPVSTAPKGDVYSRARVRWVEALRSIEFVKEALSTLPPGPLRAPVPALEPARIVASLVEGWRGEIVHVAGTDATGQLSLYKVVDPSFHNWMGLAMALRGQEISDFPLCNKSFNLSYCGHDL